MSKTPKVKQQAAAFPIPQSRDEMVEAIAEIGRRHRERDRIQARMNDELALLKQHFEEDAFPHNEAIKALSKGVQAYCEAHRSELTKGGRVKHAVLATGEIKWRMRPPSVIVRGVQAVIELLKGRGLADKLIRVKEEINKDAILLEPHLIAGIPGLSLSQGEDFIVTPFESQLEEVA
ncbi:MAG: host-nuclease inhibitor Gam family protein [Syntrophobacteraceae bacterium]